MLEVRDVTLRLKIDCSPHLVCGLGRLLLGRLFATPEGGSFWLLASRSDLPVYKKLDSRHSVWVRVSCQFVSAACF